jgi:hypothetical protein
MVECGTISGAGGAQTDRPTGYGIDEEAGYGGGAGP